MVEPIHSFEGAASPITEAFVTFTFPTEVAREAIRSLFAAADRSKEQRWAEIRERAGD
jgi:hypothetical protein